MFSNIEISNYRCFKKVDAPLRPLTVLIGENDTGKSSFLRAFDLFDLSNGRLNIGDFFDYDLEHDIEVKISTISARDSVSFSRLTHPSLRSRLLLDNSGDYSIIQEMLPFSSFSLPVQGASMVSVGASDAEGAPQLGPDGSGVPALLDYFLRRDRSRFFQLIDTLKSLIPGLGDIEITTPDASQRCLGLILENGLRLPADRASAGVRLLLFFVSLTFHPTPPRLILIEEPETGVHPKRLANIVALLRKITQGMHGTHPAQVILTTHSPYLLDSIDPTVDQVLVFRREPDGSRSVKPVDVEGLKEFLDDFMLGEVWFNVGEDGLVAKH